MEQTKELVDLFRYVNVCSGNGSSHFLPLPTLLGIHTCIVSIQASRIKRSGFYQGKMVKAGVDDKANCLGVKQQHFL